MNDHYILAELCVERVRSCLQYEVGKHCPTGATLTHIGNEPSLLLLSHKMGGSSNLGKDYCKPLYDSVQRAIVTAFQEHDPPVVLAFRNYKQQSEHKLCDVSQPIGAITAFGKVYGTPSSAARVFLHLSFKDNPSNGEANIAWVDSVIAAVKVSSFVDDLDQHRRVSWNELSSSIALAESLASHSPTLARLLPSAKQRLEELTPTQVVKRQRVSEASSSAGSITTMVVAPPTTIILAPEGGSLSQEQVDSLVAVGVHNCVTELALMPAESSVGFCRDLLLAGPEGRKKLANKITTKFADLSWKINAFKEEKLLAYCQEKEVQERIKQLEAEEKERKRVQQEADG